jgi:heat shock protein HslJ
MNSTKPMFVLGASTCLLVLSACTDDRTAPATDAAATTDAPTAAPPAAAPPTAGAPSEHKTAELSLRAGGNEPSWRVDMNATELVLTTLDGEVRAGAPAIDSNSADGAVVYVATGEQGEIALKLMDQLCVDSMSGMPHPQTVQVRVDGRELTGCGGDPASLLQGPEWTVEEIGGAALVPESAVTLNFGTDGSVSGASSCNRFMSGFELTGESLSIKQGAGSMMMCEEPLMEQEGRFLALLATINQFQITPDGALLLKAADGRTIRAKR